MELRPLRGILKHAAPAPAPPPPPPPYYPGLATADRRPRAHFTPPVSTASSSVDRERARHARTGRRMYDAPGARRGALEPTKREKMAVDPVRGRPSERRQETGRAPEQGTAGFCLPLQDGRSSVARREFPTEQGRDRGRGPPRERTDMDERLIASCARESPLKVHQRTRGGFAGAGAGKAGRGGPGPTHDEYWGERRRSRSRDDGPCRVRVYDCFFRGEYIISHSECPGKASRILG